MCHMFGVVKNKIMYGKKVKGIERSTFLIGPDGVLLQEWRGTESARPCGRSAQGRQGAQDPEESRLTAPAPRPDGWKPSSGRIMVHAAACHASPIRQAAWASQAAFCF